MDVKSNARIFNEADLPSSPGVTKGLTLKYLAGGGNQPSEKVRVILATFQPGTFENPHWHLIEAFYYVVSGRAVCTDVEGKKHDMTPGTVIYAPAGIAGAHSWEVKESMRLISVRATTDPEKTIQFDVNLKTGESSAPLDHLKRREAITFKSLY